MEIEIKEVKFDKNNKKVSFSEKFMNCRYCHFLKAKGLVALCGAGRSLVHFFNVENCEMEFIIETPFSVEQMSNFYDKDSTCDVLLCRERSQVAIVDYQRIKKVLKHYPYSGFSKLPGSAVCICGLSNNYFALGDEYGNVLIHRFIKTPFDSYILKDPSKWVQFLCPVKNHPNCVLTCGSCYRLNKNHTPKAFDYIKKKQIREFVGHTKYHRMIKTFVDPSTNKEIVCCAGWDYNVCVWEFDTGHLIHKLKHGVSRVYAVMIYQNRLIITQDQHGLINVFDFLTGKKVAKECTAIKNEPKNMCYTGINQFFSTTSTIKLFKIKGFHTYDMKSMKEDAEERKLFVVEEMEMFEMKTINLKTLELTILSIFL